MNSHHPSVRGVLPALFPCTKKPGPCRAPTNISRVPLPGSGAVPLSYPSQASAHRTFHGQLRLFTQTQGFLAESLRGGADGAAGWKVGVEERGPSCWVGAVVFAAFLKPLQRLAVTKAECRFQSCALLHFGEIQHGIDQARAASWSDVPRLGVQRHPGSASRTCGGGHVGGGHCAVILTDLDALTQIMLGHAIPPGEFLARTRAQARSSPRDLHGTACQLPLLVTVPGLTALRACPVRTVMCLAFTSGALGTITCSTPSCVAASILPGWTWLGRVIERRKAP